MTGGATEWEAVISVHQLVAADGVASNGVLRHVQGSKSVAMLMHPRSDFTFHPIIPHLLDAGLSVWAQRGRHVGNDLTLVHEEALLDVAAAVTLLREIGYERVVAIGNSGGAALYTFYTEQAGRPAADRHDVTPAGHRCGLGAATMPLLDILVLLAPHPGPGQLLLGCIDPSVMDESEPVAAEPDFDPFAAGNGFEAPPRTAHYTPEFVDRYRAAQRDRVERIDEIAQDRLDWVRAARRESAESGATTRERQGLAPHIMTVYRTDANLACVDLTIDPSDRPYGSVWGRRPDRTNYGLLGFARLTTPQAWLSTWSAISSRASLLALGPRVTLPTLLVEYTGDQATMPTQTAEIFAALGASDKRHVRVAGTHHGEALAGGPPGVALASVEIVAWLDSHHVERAS